MQRLLLALLFGAAAAFAPPARTLTSRTALGVNPIDIYSAAEDCLQEECSVDTVPRSAEHHHFYEPRESRSESTFGPTAAFPRAAEGLEITLESA